MAAAYLRAKRSVIDAGFADEITWQEDACLIPLTERRFLTEAAWVVLSAGMKETVVRRVFPAIAGAFADFVDARAVTVSAEEGGRERALAQFRHPGKIDAIIQIAFHVDRDGFGEVQRLLAAEGIDYLQTLPYIGPVTALHLAKNLGHDVAKPDRHLVRIARAYGYSDPQAMCTRIRDLVGEPIPVIDVVLWRFATLTADYLQALVPAETDIPQSFFPGRLAGVVVGGNDASPVGFGASESN